MQGLRLAEARAVVNDGFSKRSCSVGHVAVVHAAIPTSRYDHLGSAIKQCSIADHQGTSRTVSRPSLESCPQEPLIWEADPMAAATNSLEMPLQLEAPVKHADPQQDQLGRTPLHFAAAEGSLTAVEALCPLKEGVDVNAVDAAGRTPLAALDKASASAADIEAKLKEVGAVLVSPLHTGFYPLHSAVLGGDVEQVMDKLASGHTVNQHDWAGVTPLHAACGTGNIAMVKALLSNGADVSVKSRQGATPLDVALCLQNAELEAVLRDAGADQGEPTITKPPVNPSSVQALQNACGMTPLDVAAIQSAWALLSSQSQPQASAAAVRTLAVAFFELLFEREPHLLQLFYFKGTDGKPEMDEMEKHAIKVLTTLGAVVGLLDDFPTLAKIATALLTRHVGYGVLLEHYDQVLGALAAFLSDGLGALGLWDDLQVSAWTKLITLVQAVATGVYAEDA